MSSKEVATKITEYENFIEHNLKVDLKEIEQCLSSVVEKYRKWEDMKQTINILKSLTERDLNIQVPLGLDVFVNAEVNDFNSVIVDLGLGCHLEMDYNEAMKYADIRMKSLKKEIEHYRSMAVTCKVKIKTLLLGIHSLQTVN